MKSQVTCLVPLHGEHQNGLNIKDHFSPATCVSWLVASIVLYLWEDQTPAGKYQSYHQDMNIKSAYRMDILLSIWYLSISLASGPFLLRRLMEVLNLTIHRGTSHFHREEWAKISRDCFCWAHKQTKKKKKSQSKSCIWK